MKQTLTTGEIAGFCEVNLRTVIRWIDKGHLKAYKLPGRGDNRVKVEDFIAFLQSNNMPVPDEFSEESNKVLIVEDDQTTALKLEKTLQKAGYQTVVAHDGFKAGTSLLEFRPSLMTLDLDIPGLGGLDVLSYVRKTSAFSNLRVIVVSGEADDVLQQAVAQGADAIVKKPFTSESLLEQVQCLLSAN